MIIITIMPFVLYGDSEDCFVCMTHDMNYNRRTRGHCQCLWLFSYFMTRHTVQRSVALATHRFFIGNNKNLLNQVTGDMKGKMIQLSITYSGIV